MTIFELNQVALLRVSAEIDSNWNIYHFIRSNSWKTAPTLMDSTEVLDDHQKLLYSFYSACGALNNATEAIESEEACLDFIKPEKIFIEPFKSDENSVNSKHAFSHEAPPAKSFKLYESHFICFYCGRNFKSKSEIRRHIFRVCNSTNSSSRRSAKLSISRKRKKEPKFTNVCGVCGHVARKPCELRLHVNAKHTGERPFSCKECGVSFVSKSKLNRHIKNKVHAKGKFYCESCKIYFSVETNYERHITEHTLPVVKTKPFACKHCENRFNRLDILRKHLALHSRRNRNVFKCVTCDRSFSRKDTLAQHITRALCHWFSLFFIVMRIFLSYIVMYLKHTNIIKFTMWDYKVYCYS